MVNINIHITEAKRRRWKTQKNKMSEEVGGELAWHEFFQELVDLYIERRAVGATASLPA